MVFAISVCPKRITAAENELAQSGFKLLLYAKSDNKLSYAGFVKCVWILAPCDNVLSAAAAAVSIQIGYLNLRAYIIYARIHFSKISFLYRQGLVQSPGFCELWVRG